MAKLVWQPPGQASTAFVIRQERVGLGRDAGNDIRLAETAVSSRHAVIITRMGVSTLHDLNSSNGSWVNGKRVESQQLRHGDTVQFGRLAMHFIDESDATSSSAGPGATERNATVSLNSLAPAPAARATELPQAARPQLPPGSPDLGELDRLIGSIRSHRSAEDQQQEHQRALMLEEWNQLMAYCEALKARLAAEPRMRFFEISERRKEVVIRIEKKPGLPMQLIMLSWGHLEQRQRAADGIWLREPGQQDRRYEKSADASRDLLTAVAHLLA